MLLPREIHRCCWYRYKHGRPSIGNHIFSERPIKLRFHGGQFWEDHDAPSFTSPSDAFGDSIFMDITALEPEPEFTSVFLSIKR